MRGRIFGFNLIPGKGIYIKEFLQSLANASLGENYLIGCVQRAPYWIGVLLTIRDQHNFYKIKKADKEYSISAQALGTDENPVEFNFFLINPTTGRGIYQYYFHSTSMSTFCKLLKHAYEQHKFQCIEASDDKSKAKKAYVGSLTYRHWVSKDGFVELIKKLHAVKAVEIEVEEISMEDKTFRPMAEMAKSVTHVFGFSRKDSINNIAGQIKRFLAQDISDITVRGFNKEMRSVTLYPEENLESLGDFDLEEHLRGIVIHSNDLHRTITRSGMALHLMAVAGSPMVKAALETPMVIDAK